MRLQLFVIAFLCFPTRTLGFAAYNCTFEVRPEVGRVVHGLRQELCPFEQLVSSHSSVNVWVRVINDTHDHKIVHGMFCNVKVNRNIYDCLSNGTISPVRNSGLLDVVPVDAFHCKEMIEKKRYGYVTSWKTIPVGKHWARCGEWCAIDWFTDWFTPWFDVTMNDLPTFKNLCRSHAGPFPFTHEQHQLVITALDRVPAIYNHGNGRIIVNSLGIEGFGKSGTILRSEVEGGGVFLWGSDNTSMSAGSIIEPPFSSLDKYVKATYMRPTKHASNGGLLLFSEGKSRGNKSWVLAFPIRKLQASNNFIIDTFYQKMTFWLHYNLPPGAILGTARDVIQHSISNDSPHVLTHGTIDDIGRKLCDKAKFLSVNRRLKTKAGHVKVNVGDAEEFVPCKVVKNCRPSRPFPVCYGLMPVQCGGTHAFLDVHTKQLFPTASQVPCKFDVFLNHQSFDNIDIFVGTPTTFFISYSAISKFHPNSNYLFDYNDDRQLTPVLIHNVEKSYRQENSQLLISVKEQVTMDEVNDFSASKGQSDWQLCHYFIVTLPVIAAFGILNIALLAYRCCLKRKLSNVKTMASTFHPSHSKMPSNIQSLPLPDVPQLNKQATLPPIPNHEMPQPHGQKAGPEAPLTFIGGYVCMTI